jgi:hypothetical protein
VVALQLPSTSFSLYLRHFSLSKPGGACLCEMASKPTLESKGSPLSTGFSEDGFTDWGSSSGQGDVENAQAKSPHQKDEDRIEYFSLDGRQSDGRPLHWSKFQTFLRSQPPQHKACDGRIGLQRSGYRRWIGRRLGRRPSFSRMIVYLTAGYLMTLFVFGAIFLLVLC